MDTKSKNGSNSSMLMAAAGTSTIVSDLDRTVGAAGLVQLMARASNGLEGKLDLPQVRHHRNEDANLPVSRAPKNESAQLLPGTCWV